MGGLHAVCEIYLLSINNTGKNATKDSFLNQHLSSSGPSLSVSCNAGRDRGWTKPTHTSVGRVKTIQN